MSNQSQQINSLSFKKKGEDWVKRCKSLVNSMDLLLSRLYEGLESEEVQCAIKDTDLPALKGLNITNLDNNSPRQLSKKFSHCCFCLVKMFSERTPGQVKLPLPALLGVVSRCLKVVVKDVTARPSLIKVSKCLPNLHKSSMDVVGQLILTFKSHLLPVARPITDLCLQGMFMSTTAGRGGKEERSTRATAYRTLVLKVTVLGWGRYLASHSNRLVQEMKADMEVCQVLRQASEQKQKADSRDLNAASGNKKKKKKFGGAYSDLDLLTEAATLNEKSFHVDHDAVIGCLQLSRLAFESMSFCRVQALMCHVIETVKAVQKEANVKPEPYHRLETRKELYRTLASCVTCPADDLGNQRDVFSHFQLTNCGLDLLARAAGTGVEHSEIQTLCRQLLKSLTLASAMSWPVLRKGIVAKDSDPYDVSEVDQQKYELTSANESLSQTLLESQLDNERQAQLLDALRSKVADLESEVKATAMKESSRTEPDSLVGAGDTADDGDNLDLTNDEDNHKSDDDGDDGDKEMMVERIDAPECEKEDVETSAQAGPSGKENQPAHTGRGQPAEGPAIKKRLQENDISIPAKKCKPNPQEETDDEDEVNAMLLDFVDAPPDT